MNLRTYIVKALYPLCSDEVQIFIDQMKTHPDKFIDIFKERLYSNSLNPWAAAIHSGGFELIDRIVIKQQVKLLRNGYSKQLILEGLLQVTPPAEHTTTFFGDSLVEAITSAQLQPTPSKIHVSQHQLDAARLLIEKAAQKKTMKMAAKARYAK